MTELTTDQITQFKTDFPEASSIFEINLETLSSDQAVIKLNQVKQFLVTLKEREIQHKAKADQLKEQEVGMIATAKEKFGCTSLEEMQIKLSSFREEIQKTLEEAKKTLEV